MIQDSVSRRWPTDRLYLAANSASATQIAVNPGFDIHLIFNPGLGAFAEASERSNLRTRMTESEAIRLLRETYDSFNRGEFEAVLERADPEFELLPPERGVSGSEPVRGHDAVHAYLLPDAFQQQRVTPLEFVENGEVILVRLSAYARGAGSGIELEQEAFHVWRTRDGRALRLEIYLEGDRAREAAGLPPG